MNDTMRASAPAEALRAELSATAIDTRCAIVLARVALETLASAGETARANILLALENEIAGQQLEQAAGAEAVVSMLSETLLRLRTQTSRVVYLDEL